MRQNKMRSFHKYIIAFLCCMLMGGCGYKTDPVYVSDQNSTMQPKGQANEQI